MFLRVFSNQAVRPCVQGVHSAGRSIKLHSVTALTVKTRDLGDIVHADRDLIKHSSISQKRFTFHIKLTYSCT